MMLSSHCYRINSDHKNLVVINKVKERENYACKVTDVVRGYVIVVIWEQRQQV